jgi:hypothetical protein
LPLDPRFAGSSPVEDDGFLWSIKFQSTTSFRGKVKPSASCCKILQHIKDPYSMKEILVGKIQTYLAKFLLLHYLVSQMVAAKVLCWVNQE